MTDTLTWLLTKNNSSFIRARNGVQFSCEPFNLKNVNCQKFSGFAGKKAIDLSLKDKKIVLKTKIQKKASKPNSSVRSVPLNKGFRATVHTLESQGLDDFYRSDLKKAALAKWALLNRVAKVEKGVLKKKTLKRSRNQKISA